jgi:hypothetical protein
VELFRCQDHGFPTRWSPGFDMNLWILLGCRGKTVWTPFFLMSIPKAPRFMALWIVLIGISLLSSLQLRFSKLNRSLQNSIVALKIVTCSSFRS